MMDKTIKINLAGILFQIDEEAYRILRDYLQAIDIRFRHVPAGNETIEDIESRIAEIFQSQQNLAGVISKENVESMIGIIGKPEDFEETENQSESYMTYHQKRHLYRNPDDSIISGVCGGIGAYLSKDPVLFRILFILFALLFGIGFFVYIALWIALPYAKTDSQKRELHGDISHLAHSNFSGQKGYTDGNANVNAGGNYPKSSVGGAFNEIFRAIWRVCYIVIRIILIVLGVSLVLTGFLTILCIVMVFVFKYPGTYSTGVFDMHIVYLPDFLNFIVNPKITPWIIALSLIVIILPMLALIYWGVKLIFFFKARDGVFTLTGFILWILAITALAIILFNEGVSFTSSARYSIQKVFSHSPDTLYVKTEKKISDLKFDKQLFLGQERYAVFMNEEKNELYIRPYLNVNSFYGNDSKVEIRKNSSGRNKVAAARRAEDLVYNFRIDRDTLFLDEYFTISSGRRWSADYIGIELLVQKGTVLKLDSCSELLLNQGSGHRYNIVSGSFQESHWWKLTDEGLDMINSTSSEKK
jgi:phage shock protein PspC (stress-responsive transcriptional regulator)